jgi:hypothetical protein
MKLIEPNIETVRQSIHKFLSSKEYEGPRNTAAALKLAFKSFPNNMEIPEVLIKTSALNDLFRTNIFATPELAKHITNLNIDEKLKRGDLSVIAEIARFEIKEKTKTFYSFATKYCHWHNQTEYPIFDSRVHNSLVAYKRQDGFAEFTEEDLRHYPSFKEVINSFLDYYSLSGISYKELDKFLWLNDREKAYDIGVMREVLPNAYKSWSNEEDEELANLYNSGMTKIKDLAVRFQRNEGAIRSRLKRLINY